MIVPVPVLASVSRRRFSRHGIDALGTLGTNLVVMKLGESLQQEHGEESRHERDRDAVEVTVSEGAAIGRVRVHRLEHGVRHHVEEGHSEHGPCHEAECQLKPPVGQAKKPRYRSSQQRCTDDGNAIDGNERG